MIKERQASSYLFGGNMPFVEDLYESYLDNPASVSDQWRTYFDSLQHLPGASGPDTAHGPIIASFADRARRSAQAARPAAIGLDPRQLRVLQLIHAYRFLGASWAQLDPLKRIQRPHAPELEPSFYGFTEADFGEVFSTGGFVGLEKATLREIIEALRQTYCGSIGVEYMYMGDSRQKQWIQERLEPVRSQPSLTAAERARVLERVTAAETLEKYLHTRYVGQKRFSLEGGESAIVSLDELIRMAGGLGVQEIVIGMAHRGRLNVLVNTLGKSPGDLFAEFEGKAQSAGLSAGDVKYHQGFSVDIATPGGPLHLTLAFNPSHLEIINPVVEGSVYARQRRRGDKSGAQVLPVLIHGDAAIAGQGVVQETLNLSQTRGYGTGGTVHLVINNQIGFTTSDPRDVRSTIWCTDVLKMVDAPIFHVNGDDPEAVAFVTRLAMEFRQTFRKDVVVDLICFRKLGHNEQDEPMVTQPLMYKKIAAHPGTRQIYADRLVAQGTVAPDVPAKMIDDYRAALDRGELLVNPVLTSYQNKFATDWTPYFGQPYSDECDTAVALAELSRLAARLVDVPHHFALHPRVRKIIDDRTAMGRGELPLDWGMGETLAYATLLESGFPVRISGEDSGRGTFFHRHAVLHEQNRERWDEGSYVPLQHLGPNQAPFVVIDSVLSEEAVLGFEYGYATAQPAELVVWEAQFGDFANGAQVLIDQFISSGEAKWGRLCGLVMMLPHGYEGQGPEHSSARLERYLQLCAEKNMQVCVPTTPAQIFHLLRRQMLRKVRKPLVILTPKSLLRHKEATSPLDDLARGGFQTVIGESEALDPKKVRRIVLCTGKIYYELLAARRERSARDIALVRIEQLYPFPEDAYQRALAVFPLAKEIVWCQEEPRNQGAWYSSRHRFQRNLGPKQKLHVVAPPPSASPAPGYLAKHVETQKAVLNMALSPIGD